jgi:hypothetical protein
LWWKSAGVRELMGTEAASYFAQALIPAHRDIRRSTEFSLREARYKLTWIFFYDGPTPSQT